MVSPSQLTRVLVGLGLIAITAANIYVFPRLNGEGFVKSHDGYWTLHPEDSDDFRYIVDSHANRRADSMMFYLQLGDYARGESVITPPGLLDSFRLKALTHAVPVVTNTYDHYLDEVTANRLAARASVEGTFFSGPNYRIIKPPSRGTSTYRIMMSNETVVAIPEDLLAPQTSGDENA